MLTQIGYSEIKDDERLHMILEDVRLTIARYGDELRLAGEEHWWQMNDILDDVICMQEYLTKRLK